MTPHNVFEKTPGIPTSIDLLRYHVIRSTQKWSKTHTTTAWI